MTLMEWAIDVPQKPLQCDAIVNTGANHERRLRTDCYLQLGNMKKEFRVIVYQYRDGEPKIRDVLTARHGCEANVYLNGGQPSQSIQYNLIYLYISF